jgi:hypothetical protein
VAPVKGDRIAKHLTTQLQRLRERKGSRQPGPTKR